MGLHLHRAERTDLLVDGLGALLAKPLPDPFAEELVLVPSDFTRDGKIQHPNDKGR